MQKLLLATYCVLCWAVQVKAQNIPIYKFEDLQRFLERRNDTVFVLNFWATWCRPCIEELPYFEQARIDFSHQKVKIILVCLDERSNLESKVKTFLERQRIKNQVVLLDDTNYNRWLPQLEPTWEGAIPATLFYNPAKKQRTFVEKSLTQTALYELIKKHL